MRCTRCAADMLPSDPTCGYCRHFSDDALEAKKAEVAPKRRRARLTGLTGIAAGFVICIVGPPAIAILELDYFSMLAVGVFVGAWGASRWQDRLLYRHLKYK